MTLATIFLVLDGVVFVAIAALIWQLRADRLAVGAGVALLVARVVVTWWQQRTLREKAE